MITFEPNSLYSMDEIKAALDGLMGLRTFMDTLDLNGNRVHRSAVWGFEIIAAAKNAPSFSERTPAPDLSEVLSKRRGRAKPESKPIVKLKANDVL